MKQSEEFWEQKFYIYPQSMTMHYDPNQVVRVTIMDKETQKIE